MKNLEIYIHIPFCVRKCEYCDFLSFPADDDAKLRYVKGLMAEMIFYGPLMKNYQVSSVYIGGGTPSSIDEQWIAALMGGVFDCFNVLPDAEISIECNPGTLSREKLLAYKDAGINRLSIGLQSANNDELKRLGRITRTSYMIWKRRDRRRLWMPATGSMRHLTMLKEVWSAAII